MHENYELILRVQKLGQNLKNIATKREISSVPLKPHFLESIDSHKETRTYQNIFDHKIISSGKENLYITRSMQYCQ